MKTTQVMMDIRLVNAIKALETYAELFARANLITKLKTTHETLDTLKALAYDTAEHITIDDPEGDNLEYLEETAPAHVDSVTEDFGEIIDDDIDVTSIDHQVCHQILWSTIRDTAGFIWYDNMPGAHSVWTAKALKHVKPLATNIVGGLIDRVSIILETYEDGLFYSGSECCGVYHSYLDCGLTINGHCYRIK